MPLSRAGPGRNEDVVPPAEWQKLGNMLIHGLVSEGGVVRQPYVRILRKNGKKGEWREWKREN